MGTGQKKTRWVLGKVTRADAEAVLKELANTGPDFSDTPINELSLLDRYKAVFGGLKWNELYLLQINLRKAWDAPDRRRRDWYVFQMRQWFSHSTRSHKMRDHPDSYRDRNALEYMYEPPAVTPFEATAFYFQTIGDFARHCLNPECARPYFIAKKRNQKYCSEKCAGPALREQKRRWWKDNRGKGALS